jgi:tyrosyl-tRNA synthetase
MYGQVERLWENAISYMGSKGHGDLGQRRILDNATWLEKVTLMDFLRALGNGMRVGPMLGRDT